MKNYFSVYREANPDVKRLRILVKAVVQELDDRKEELIAAMYELNGKILRI